MFGDRVSCSDRRFDEVRVAVAFFPARTTNKTGTVVQPDDDGCRMLRDSAVNRKCRASGAPDGQVWGRSPPQFRSAGRSVGLHLSLTPHAGKPAVAHVLPVRSGDSLSCVCLSFGEWPLQTGHSALCNGEGLRM